MSISPAGITVMDNYFIIIVAVKICHNHYFMTPLQTDQVTCYWETEENNAYYGSILSFYGKTVLRVSSYGHARI